MSRFLIITAGSLGDLHPYLAIAMGLRERGHEVVVGTCPRYRQTVESLGLGFHPVRPDCDWLRDPEKVRRLSHPRKGLLRVSQEWLMPAIRESYEDISSAAKGADVLVTMLPHYSARLVAEKAAIPWVSAMHIPLGFFSAYEPPLLEFSPALSKRLRFLGPAFWRPLFWIGMRSTRFLAKPWYRLRSELGLPPTSEINPLVSSHSPHLILALFSKHLADKQPDWPPQTVITGFPFYDRDAHRMPPLLDQFLSAGPPPIVFTLGTAVSGDPGEFFEMSLECARLLNQRAVLIVGKGNPDRLAIGDAYAIAVEYAPFTELFPRAAAIVHHGGVGTTGQAMRAGRPMLIVPHAWDQPDNAERAVRLGIARAISKQLFTPKRAAAELKQLIDDPAYSRRASEVGQQVGKEDGVGAACDALEKVVRCSATARDAS